METEMMSSFLPLTIDFFVTSHSTLYRSGNFGISVPVGVIFINDANGSVDMLKKLSVALLKNI
jgi:hypothetical protein